MERMLYLLSLLVCNSCWAMQLEAGVASTRASADSTGPSSLSVATDQLLESERAVQMLLEDTRPYQTAVTEVAARRQEFKEARRREAPDEEYAAYKAMLTAEKAADEAAADAASKNPQVAAAEQNVKSAQAEVDSILSSEARSMHGPTSGDILIDRMVRVINEDNSGHDLWAAAEDARNQGLVRDRLKRAIPVLSKMVQDGPQPYVRVNAIDAISVLGPPLDDEVGLNVSQILANALNDSDAKVRYKAADSLYELGGTFYGMARYEGRLLPAIRQRANAETNRDTKELITTLVDFLDKHLRPGDKAE